MTRANDIARGIDFITGIDAGEVVPHIIPGVLYPAVAGKLLDGSTSHGATYGVAQSDGRSYYYTDIKGSKPIKDPRIGAHFGGQRHKVRSMQLLDQETATHGQDVFSVDGREWFRVTAPSNKFVPLNNLDGQRINFDSTSTFAEVVGYFSGFNVIHRTKANAEWRYSLDGATEVATSYGAATNTSPLAGRYVDSGSIINIPISTTLGIHTIKLRQHNTDLDFFGIELIAQDTSSTANRSKIQIPSQDVVSYGKKFTVSGTPHYNPFDGMSGAKTLAQLGDYIDTATSLGMDNWKAGTANYYKPFNGGRVVKWVDSSGTIKTSVTMMPPNAQKGIELSETGSAANAYSDGEVQAGTNDHTITFNTSAIDHSLSEVAKTHSIFEFGNGAGNAGRNANYADASQLGHTDVDDIAFCMDDGLTSLVANRVTSPEQLMYRNEAASYYDHTFIGTGISLDLYWGSYPGKTIVNVAQNLPYGTHVLLNDVKDSHVNEMIFTLDGVVLTSGHALGNTPNYGYITYHQPKMPPIDDEAVIISDYMLMASYVQNTSASIGTISKGVRRSGASRDHHYNCASAMAVVDTAALSRPWMFSGPGSGSHTMPVSLPYFGTSFTSYGNDQSQTHTFTLDGSAVTPTELDGDGVSQDMFYHAVSTLGLHTKVHTLPSGGYRFTGTDVATPTHTSSHYQEFETPVLLELVGGDRNMEQTNLVVTPDGKTWDQVTRDTSYIGNVCVAVPTDTSDPNHDMMLKTAMHWRGASTTVIEAGNKNFAISYDRLICLVDGWYQMSLHIFSTDSISSSDWAQIRINNNRLIQTYQHDQDRMTSPSCSAVAFIRRRDYITFHAANMAADEEGNRIEIIKLEK